MSPFAEYVRSQADWRREKAEEYPDDQRNAQSARALDSLADYVEKGDHRPLWMLDLLDEQAELHATPSGVAAMGERAARELSRYGFGWDAETDWQHADTLNELVPLASQDAYELVATATPDDDRSDEHLAELAEHYGLNPWEIAAALDGVVIGPEYFRRRQHWSEQQQVEALDYERAADEDLSAVSD